MDSLDAWCFEFEGYRLDRRKRTLVDPGDEPVRLTAKAFDALQYFVEHPGEVIERSTMLEAIWPNTIVEENSLSQTVAALRRTLGEGFIVTVPRRGYQFVAEVRDVSGQTTVEPRPEIPNAAISSAGATVGSAPGHRGSKVLARGAWALLALTVATGLVTFAYRYDFSTDGADTQSLPKVAVLPCENLSPDPDDAYVAAGLHEEILNRLAQLRGLLVVARTSVMQYAETRPSITQIARELDAAAVMECSIRYAGNRIMVTAQLIDPATETHLWSGSYPGDLNDLSGLFEMQSDIATSIATALDAELSPAERRRLEALPTESPAAYAQFLRALEDDLAAEATLRHLDQAVEIDPRFAEAYATRGVSHLARAWLALNDPDSGLDLQIEFELGHRDAERALALDPQLGLGHLVRATRHAYPRLEVEALNRGIEQALELSPNHSLLLSLAAGFYLAQLRTEDAHVLLQRIRVIDPNRPIGEFLAICGDVDGAIDHERQRLQWNPSDLAARSHLVLLETIRGRTDQAMRERSIIEEMRAIEGSEWPLYASTIYTLGRLGLHDIARRRFEQARREADNQSPTAWIYHHLGIGDVDGAYEWAERVASQPLPPYARYELHFVLNTTRDPVLDRPEFVALRQKLGYIGNR
jgi:TolB-like protein/DNA-binding winged helix-turn-helix (wHTH) protein